MIQLNIKNITFAAINQGKMPEWSIGPHSKCGERVTVPRVRIPVFPLIGNNQTNSYRNRAKDVRFLFFLF